MTHLNFPDSLKVPFCVAQTFKVRPIPWFGLLSFSFWYRHRTLVSISFTKLRLNFGILRLARVPYLTEEDKNGL